jgi:tRNA pseudouridine32 synthase/23S rRNA pseudouridine746 synthase
MEIEKAMEIEPIQAETGIPSPELPPYLVPHSQDVIRVLYEDDLLLIVDKPHLLLSVPGRHPLNKDSLIGRLASRFPGVAAVHRLDLDTSGLLVVPKTREALSILGRHFQERQVKKVYYALVWGNVEHNEGQIDLPLIADWENRPRQKVCVKTGKPSLTQYEVIDRRGETTLLKLIPVTGRSHQLRLHLREIGHPILGCDMYAHDTALQASPRLLLHASALQLCHPTTGTSLSAFSPIPFDVAGWRGQRPG